MDEKCFLIIAIILGVLILIVLVVIMIYSIIIKERIDDILLQKFNENEISYKNFKNIISEVVNVFYINLKSVINKINIFDEEEKNRNSYI